MTFFSRIGGFFKRVGSGIQRRIIKPIGAGIIKTKNWVNNTIIQPAVSLVKSIGSSAKAVIVAVPKVLEKIANKVPEVIDKSIDASEKIIDASGSAGATIISAGGETVGGFGKFFSNPMSWLLAGGAAFIIVPKVLDKM